MAVTPTPFDVNDPKWQSCCGCHIKTGVLVVGIIEVVTYVMVDLLFFGWFHWPLLGWLFSVFSGVAIILLFVAFCNEDGRFLIPHMIYQVLKCISGGAAAVAFIVFAQLLRYGNPQAPQWAVESGYRALMTFGILFAIDFGLQVYFCVIVFRGYRFFEADRHFRENPVFYNSEKDKKKKRKKKQNDDEDSDSEDKKKKKKDEDDSDSENKKKKKKKKKDKDDDSD